MAILIVEDDDFSAQIMQDTLETEGYETIKAGNGVEGLAVLKTRKQDVELILLDRMMPEMDGMTFIDEGRKQGLTDGIPIIMQTAAGSQKEVIEGASQGVYYYLTKPYEYNHLLAVVRSALDENEE